MENHSEQSIIKKDVVLVIDDDADAREILIALILNPLFEDSEKVILEASSYQKAIDLLKQYRNQLLVVISDGNLKSQECSNQLEGIELTKKALDEAKAPIVILSTSHYKCNLELQALDPRVLYWQKPISPMKEKRTQLQALLNEITEKSA